MRYLRDELTASIVYTALVGKSPVYSGFKDRGWRSKIGYFPSKVAHFGGGLVKVAQCGGAMFEPCLFREDLRYEFSGLNGARVLIE